MSPEELMKDDFFYTPPPSLIDSPFTPTIADSRIGLSSTAFAPRQSNSSDSTTSANYRTSLTSFDSSTCGTDDFLTGLLANPIYDHTTDPDSWNSLFENPVVVATPPPANVSLPINSAYRRSQSTSAISTSLDRFSPSIFSDVSLDTKFSREKRSSILMADIPEESAKADDLLENLNAFTEEESRPVKRLKAEAQFNILSSSSSSIRSSPAQSSETLPPIIVKDPTDRKAVRRARNTLAARRSRDKKKEHLESLESRIKELELRNEKLYQENQFLRSLQNDRID